MRWSRSALLAALALVACATGPAPVAAPAPPPGVAPVAAPAVSSPPAPDARPTERTDEQKRRDEARAPLANAIVDAYENYAPKLSSDRQKVLFGSNRDGNRQYYLSDVLSPSAPPLPLTHGSERATGATFSRDGKSVFFLRDAGVDENFRIFKVDLDGKSETCLTPGPVLRRSSPIEPKKRPGTLVYWQREAKSAATDIVVQTIGGEPKVVYTDPSPTTLEGVSNDGKRALVLRRYSSSDYVLFELDLETGHLLQRLYPEEGKKVSIHATTYAADGKRAFVAADDGAEGQYLFAINVADGKISGQYRQSEPATAYVDNVIASPRGDRLAIVIDAGDHSEARILDAQSLRVETKVNAPLGTLSLTRFSPDGAKIGATLSQADTPSDIFAIDSATGALAPLRRDARPGLDQLEPMGTFLTTVPAFDGLSIPVIVHLPLGARTKGRQLPVIVAFHGGPSGSSSIEWNTFARFFTELGYAFLEPNVRGSTGYGRAYEMADDREKRADWLKDLATVNAWTKAQPWAAPDRVIAMGGSYGGYTVLMALTRQPTLWRAGVDYVGIANLFTFLRSTTQWLRAVWVDEFGDLDKDVALLDRFSPLREVDRITAPLYVYAGQNDPRVPREESDQVVVALRKRSVPVEYQVAANEGHSLNHRETQIEFLTRVARFLEDYVK
jgi:dipeptidyl aminopeptidase/acylaminoacyl peptidase